MANEPTRRDDEENDEEFDAADETLQMQAGERSGDDAFRLLEEEMDGDLDAEGDADSADDDFEERSGMDFSSPAFEGESLPPPPPPRGIHEAYPQHFFLLFCSLAMAIGVLLPWERTHQMFNLAGTDSIGGGFLLLFAVYGVIACLWNIHYGKMIVWPVLLGAVDGMICGWGRVLSILPVDKLPPEHLGKFDAMRFTVIENIRAIGPGLYLVTIFSTLVMLSIVKSIFSAAKADSARKEAEREMRAADRASRRR